MSGSILALNCGSSSVKFAIYSNALELIVRGSADGIGTGAGGEFTVDGKTVPAGSSISDHLMAIEAVLRNIEQYVDGLAAVGHRVVHGGMFEKPVVVDAEARDKIAALAPLAPSHQPHNIAGIDAIRNLAPDLPQIAVFDTAFHRTIPEHRQLMPIPRRYAREGLRRFGFHGISYASIVPRLRDYIGDEGGGRVVVCHLGNGCSLAGLVAGISQYTSMGFTPLDGLMMGKRPGRLDPGVVLWLVERHRGDAGEVNRILNMESGLLAVSGTTSDMRSLLADSGADASLAIRMFVDRLVQEIGAAAAAIGGLDALVFTGGIGENAVALRAATIRRLEWLGIEIDDDANTASLGTISTAASRATAHVIPTMEERLIAQAARALISPTPEKLSSC